MKTFTAVKYSRLRFRRDVDFLRACGMAFDVEVKEVKKKK